MKGLILSTCCLCLFTGSISDEEKVVIGLTVEPQSTLTINGKTNVSKYQCAITEYKGSDTLSLTAERGKGAVFTKGFVRLAASGFDCGKKLMTNDFAKTIKADQFPFIVIEFISFGREPRFDADAQKFMGKLKISLAETTVPFDVKCSITKDEQGYFHLEGSRDFTFADFKLNPPSKMIGLVKVDEKLSVNFHLILHKL